MVKPLLMAMERGLNHLLSLFFSIVGGLAAYGFIGVFFGPLLLGYPTHSNSHL